MKQINLLLVLITAITSIVAYPSLPSLMPMHWNFVGEIDNWMPKSQAVWFFPLLVAAMWVSFQIFPKFDPKREKYSLFAREWGIMQAGLLGFFVYLQLCVYYIAAHPSVSMLPLIFAGFGTLFILMGNYLSKIRQNYFIGIKVPWTLNSEDNWNKTHRFASWTFVIAGIIAVLESLLNWYAPFVVFGSILVAAILPILYSYHLYASSKHR